MFPQNHKNVDLLKKKSLTDSNFLKFSFRTEVFTCSDFSVTCQVVFFVSVAALTGIITITGTNATCGESLTLIVTLNG